MRVRQSHEIGLKSGRISLLKTRRTERTGFEKTRCGIRVGGRLVGMQRTAVVLGGTELVSAGG